jgi:hypothetical protein
VTAKNTARTQHRTSDVSQRAHDPNVTHPKYKLGINSLQNTHVIHIKTATLVTLEHNLKECFDWESEPQTKDQVFQAGLKPELGTMQHNPAQYRAQCTTPKRESETQDVNPAQQKT